MSNPKFASGATLKLVGIQANYEPGYLPTNAI